LFKEEINFLYDSKCNLCAWEVAFLKRKDTEKKIRFTDIESLDYDASDPANGNVSYHDAMKYMTAVKANGEVVSGVRVFREVYDVLGIGWVYAITSWPLLGPIFDSVYKSWAMYRTNLTRGVSLDELVRERVEKMAVSDSTKCTSDGTSCQAYKRAKNESQ
jgi:predicted DCC family thiol-disulfide oxidoreductase YuxK